MSVILLEKDPFVDIVSKLAGGSYEDKLNVNVRRPLQGIAIKEDTFAYVAVFQSSLDSEFRPISLINSSAPKGNADRGYAYANHNFILQNVRLQRSEKFQIIETFGDHFTFFYGEKPTLIQCSGLLFNTIDFNWKNEWLRNYDQYLRGTKCVEHKARVYLSYDDVLLEGYMVMTSVDQNQDLPYMSPFGFQLLLTNYTDLSIDNENYVHQAEHARTQGGTLVEYLSAVEEVEYYAVNAETGISEPVSGSSGDVPSSTQESGTNSRSAFWTSARKPHEKMWKNPGEALIKLDVDLSAQRAGVDSVTAVTQLRKDASAFPLSSRSDSLATLGTSLDIGVANSVSVLGAEPDLGG